MGMKRIFHPTLNEFRDVPSDQAGSWKALGWRFTNGGHVTAAEGGVGVEKPVTDSYPFGVGDVAGVSPTLVTGPAAAVQVSQASPTASTGGGKQ